MKYWVGVKNSPPQTVFTEEDESKVNETNYPQFAYCVGPFDNLKEASLYSDTHRNIDGTFTDPFCNNGQGR